MQILRIRQVGLAAPDMDASIAFYRDVLGAEMIARFDPPGLAFFNIGGVRLLLEKNAMPATLYYEVDDIDVACNALKAKGIAIDQEPHMIFKDTEGTFGTAGEEEWMAFIKDPADNIVGLTSRK